MVAGLGSLRLLKIYGLFMRLLLFLLVFTLFPYTTLFRSCSGSEYFPRLFPEWTPGYGRSRPRDRKSTRLNSSHTVISYAVFCLKKKRQTDTASPFFRSDRSSDRCYLDE